MVDIYKPYIFSQFDNLAALQSNRHGGFSTVPYSSLNVGLNTEDDPGCVQKNREHLFRHLGISSTQIAQSFQVHGDQILKVDQPVQAQGYDALITNQANLFLAVTIADCTPILVYDAKSKAIAAIHAGWRGTQAGIVTKTLKRLKQAFEVDFNNCYVYIGTCIDTEAFEVGKEVADQFDPAFKVWNTTSHKFHVNLKAANKAQLTELGVPETQIEISPYCTYANNEDYFSHRREQGKTGRMLAIIGRKL